MAEINQEILKRTLVINVEDGTGADGTTKYKAKNFNGTKEYDTGNYVVTLNGKQMDG